MRRLPKHYHQLQNGLSRIRELNQRFQLEWRASVSRWNQAADQEYAERWAASEQARETWEAIHNQVRPKRVAGWILLLVALPLICPGACALSVSGGLTTESTFYDFCDAISILIGIAAGVYGLQLVSRASAAVRQVADQLKQNPTIAFDPKRPRSLPNPYPPQRRKVPAVTDLTGLWWKHLENEALQDRVPSKYGDIGELDLMDELKRSLPDSYFAIRGVMVAEHLDIDILLLGPTGIWNLESKYISGEITFVNGHWRREKDWVENGIQHHKDEILKDLHVQWLWERDLLERRLRSVLPGWDGTIKGGLVSPFPMPP